MSLYGTYRPKAFSEVVGQHHIIDILLAQAQHNQFSSSYLLYGPRGTGKTSTARLLAKVVNCTTFTADGLPDLANDPQAQLIDAGKTLDFVEIDAASHTGVDNIREEIIDKALYPPTSLKVKVYVIDEVHMLSKGAFNALLKIMEEPRSYLLFVLATTEIHKVPDTIISRCQVFNFKHITPADITERLAYIAQQEHIIYEPAALALIAKVSQGAMRDAIKYLEQVSVLGEVTQQQVAQFLGIVPEQKIHDLISFITTGTFEEVSGFLDELVEGGTDFVQLSKEVLLFLDEHFLENPALYAPFAGMIEEIALGAKLYPHPVLLRKRKIWKRCEERDGASVGSVHAKSPLTSDPVIREEVAPTMTANKTSTPVSAAKEKSTPSFVELMSDIAERIDNMMLKSVLKKQAMIEGIVDGVLTIVIINEQYFHSLQKPEIAHQIQAIASELLQTPLVIKRRYMTKEEFILAGSSPE